MFINNFVCCYLTLDVNSVCLEKRCSFLHYRVFLQRLALTLELHCQRLIKTAAARCDQNLSSHLSIGFFRTRYRSLARQEIFHCHSCTRHSLTRHQCETSLQLQLCIRESRDPRYRGLSVSNGEARLLGTIKFFELLDASLQLREIFDQNSDLAALFQQFAFHLLVVFHVFFLFFRSHALTRTT